MIAFDKRWMVFPLAFAYVMAALLLPCAGGEEIKITWHEEITLSADLSGVPLNRVLEHLSSEHGMAFKVPESVADHRVSVRFTELSLEEGLKRILTGLDYSLEFDGQGQPCAIVIIGEEKSSGGATRPATPAGSVSREPGSRNTGPTGPDLPSGGDGDFGPLGPAKSPVESSREPLSPYGPTGYRFKEQGQPTDIASPFAPVESDQTSWPYGTGHVAPEKQESPKKGTAPPSPAESVRNPAIPPSQHRNTASP
ncbi:MAG: hypothetical protein SWE60_00595 [Thermodesulfobacteriota bacterium]|nr:hypothetical protein [Thermodesulfobacteriota bacterium]